MIANTRDMSVLIGNLLKLRTNAVEIKMKTSAKNEQNPNDSSVHHLTEKPSKSIVSRQVIESLSKRNNTEFSQTEQNMKKWLIAIAAAFVISSAAQAGEEIKLAAAIGSGAAAKPAPAAESGTASSTAASAGTMTTANMVAVGVIAVAGLAAVANSDSSSSH